MLIDRHTHTVTAMTCRVPKLVLHILPNFAHGRSTCRLRQGNFCLFVFISSLSRPDVDKKSSLEPQTPKDTPDDARDNQRKLPLPREGIDYWGGTNSQPCGFPSSSHGRNSYCRPYIINHCRPRSPSSGREPYFLGP